MTIPHPAKLPAVAIWRLASCKAQVDQVTAVAVLGCGSLENVVRVINQSTQVWLSGSLKTSQFLGSVSGTLKTSTALL